MKVKRVKTSFVTADGTGGREGDLVPANHPLVARVPANFEDLDDYLARKYPEYFEEVEPKKRGRPVGSKNQPKPTEPKQQSEPRQLDTKEDEGER